MNTFDRMRINEAKFSYEYISSILKYCPEDGTVRWKVRRPGIRKGDIAGTIDNRGYRRIKVDGVKLRGSRIAWLLYYGVWPTGFIDHIYGNKESTHIKDIRDTDWNNGNKSEQSNNTSGHVCIRKQRGKWCVQVRCERKQHTKALPTLKEAIAWRNAKWAELGFHPHHGLNAEIRKMLS